MLREKGEVLCVFMKFKRLVESGFDYKLKNLCTNWGSEFLSQNFSKVCEEEDIESHLTASYIKKKQDDMVVWRNCIVMNIAWSLLKSMQVPTIFVVRQYDMWFVF